jgi:protein gp37
MGHTDIPYCDCTWDLTIGCRKRSPGCANCWATRTVQRLAGAGLDGYCTHHDRDRTDRETRVGEIQTSYDGKDWLPTAAVNLLHWNLAQPSGWRKPRFIFVNSKSDLFDERVPFSFVTRVWGAMAMAPQHKYMILTKEPGRLAQFIAQYQQVVRVPSWPNDFPHVILMVSVEDAEHLGRIDQLLRIPAAHYGVSFEPLLGPVSEKIGRYLWRDRNEDDDLDRYGQLLDWVVLGCEKRAGGRAGRWASADGDGWWAETDKIAELCEAVPVPLWVKQGPVLTKSPKRGPARIEKVCDDMAEFPPTCQIQQHPRWPGSRTGSD